MKEMKTFNGYEIVDALARDEIDGLKKSSFQKGSVVQTPGNSPSAVMSQNAVTQCFEKIENIVIPRCRNGSYMNSGNSTGITFDELVPIKDAALVVKTSVPKGENENYWWVVVGFDGNGAKVYEKDPYMLTDVPSCNITVPDEVASFAVSLWITEKGTNAERTLRIENDDVGGVPFVVMHDSEDISTQTLFEMVNPNKNLIGMEAKVYYPVLLPKGTKLTMSTSDGSSLEAGKCPTLYCYGVDKVQNQYWAFNASSYPRNTRTIALEEDTYYILWDKTHDVPIQVEIGAQATSYEEYKGTLFNVDKLKRLYIIPGEKFISIDSENGTITIPYSTEFIGENIHIDVSQGDIVLNLNDSYQTTSSVILYDRKNDTFVVKTAGNMKVLNLNDMYYVCSVRRKGAYGFGADINTPYYYDGVLIGGDNSSNGAVVLTSEQISSTERFASLFTDTTGLVESFIFFTDPHFGTWTNLSNKFDEYLDTVKAVYDAVPVSMCVSGGDWLNNGNTKENACLLLGKIDGALKSRFDKYINIVGNHDTNYQGEEYIDSGYDKEASERMTLSNSAIRNLWYRKQGKAYFAIDGDNTKFYVFDTGIDWVTDMDDYRWEQISWFANSLKNDKPERCAAMLHIGMEYSATVFIDNLTKIAQAFNNRSTITMNGITYDFTEATGHFYFVLSGHTHSDENFTQNTIPVVATTELKAGNEVTFDLVLADYATNTLHLVRVGSGSDRQITMA